MRRRSRERQRLALLIEDLRAVTRANMEDEINSFAEALNADLVLPEDF